MQLDDVDILEILRRFVWISGTGFGVKIISMCISPAINSFVDSVSEVSPWAGLLAVVLVATSTIADIRDAYKKGLAGLAVLTLQFLSFWWVMWIFIAGFIVDRLIAPGIIRASQPE